MKNIFSVFKRKKSSEVAKDRLKILLISDRVNCSPEVMERIKKDIADVISKYMKIDVNSMEIQISKTGMKSMNASKTPTLYANIPILDLRNK
ncbi:MAG: cell division topological specificity factor MinE [Lachnospiraceae bacterium]|nr:cell division topological specificity factor MinE [Lachnospiraceae bacterium]MBQ7832032.1 cell division topological specificity factor MinE [Lachnospiraceae bacterium]